MSVNHISQCLGTVDALDDGAVASVKWRRILFVGIVAGLILRFVIGVLFTFNYDTNAWLITPDSVDAYGSIYQGNGFWYPPVYGCILTFVSVFINMFGIDTGTICYELVGAGSLANVSSTYVLTPAYAITVKSVLFVFDLVNAWLIYRIVGKNHDVRKATIASLLWFLCPLVIWSSAVAAQIDTVSATFMLLSLYLMMDKRYFLSGSMMTFGFLTKLFPIVLVFLLLAYVLSHSCGRRDGVRNVVACIAGFVITAAVMLLPYMVNGELDSVFSFFTGRASSVAVGISDLSKFSPFVFNNIINYAPLILLAEALIAWSYYSKASVRGDDDHMSLLTHALLSFLVVFVFGQSLTYPVVMVPLLVAYIVMLDGRLMLSYGLLSVISVLYCFSNFHAWLLCSISVFWDVIPIEQVIEAAHSLAPTMSVLFNTMAKLGVLPAVTAFALMVYRRYEYAKA